MMLFSNFQNEKIARLEREEREAAERKLRGGGTGRNGVSNNGFYSDTTSSGML